MAGKKDKTKEVVIENRRARFEYHIGDTLECGIVLRGSEVKSLRDGQVSLQEGFVRALAEPPALLLHAVDIGEYGPSGPVGNGRQHARVRARVLLAHKGEILKLAKQMAVKGMTIVPLKLYFKNGFAKVLIGVGKGKAKHDKREAMGKRDAERDMARAMSRKVL